MRELLSKEPGKVAWYDYDEAPLPPGHVRVRSRLTAVKHGTEAGLVNRSDPFLRKRYDPELAVFRDFGPGETLPDQPVAVGNMTVGRVTEVGEGVEGFRPGDLVYGWLGIRETHSPLAERLWLLPKGVGEDAILLLDPGDYALCGVRDGGVRLGDRVAVFGLGAIGLMAVQVLRAAGASQVFAVDPIEARRALALNLGATAALDPAAGDVGLLVKEETGGGADVALELSGSARALGSAIRATCFGGTIVTVGLYKNSKGLELGLEWHVNQQRLIASRSMSEPNRDHPAWDRARLRATVIRLFQESRLCADGLLGPVVPFAEAQEAYTELLRNPALGVKLTVRYGD